MGWRVGRGGGVYRSKGYRAKLFRKNPTQAEARVWELLRAGRIDGIKFRRQHQIGSFIVDFCSLRERLIVEINGSAHDGQEAQAYDAKRRQFLQDTGFHVLDIDNEEVLGDPWAVEAKIRQTLTALPRHSASPPGEADLAAAEALRSSQEGSPTAPKTLSP